MEQYVPLGLNESDAQFVLVDRHGVEDSKKFRGELVPADRYGVEDSTKSREAFVSADRYVPVGPEDEMAPAVGCACCGSSPEVPAIEITYVNVPISRNSLKIS
jgi:hypothetical protein